MSSRKTPEETWKEIAWEEQRLVDEPLGIEDQVRGLGRFATRTPGSDAATELRKVLDAVGDLAPIMDPDRFLSFSSLARGTFLSWIEAAADRLPAERVRFARVLAAPQYAMRSLLDEEMRSRTALSPAVNPLDPADETDERSAHPADSEHRVLGISGREVGCRAVAHFFVAYKKGPSAKKALSVSGRYAGCSAISCWQPARRRDTRM